MLGAGYVGEQRKVKSEKSFPIFVYFLKQINS